ncbi:hypothetical protein QE152_g12535 [Popillia japonica]|uniref:Uncharacterized protein n=1 Tax=Popillia japonica TaxID=7064 RepID=A0AAW1LIM4_POPJA
MELNKAIEPCAVGQGRKKLRQQSNREIMKIARHRPKHLPTFPTCAHNGKPGFPYFCSTLRMSQIKRFHQLHLCS